MQSVLARGLCSGGLAGRRRAKWGLGGLDWTTDDKASSTFAAGFRKLHFVRSQDDLKVREGKNGLRLCSWDGSNALGEYQNGYKPSTLDIVVSCARFGALLCLVP
eukprot:6476062-Amphidinium_carterae.1